MKDFTVEVRKLTDEELMREACETTFLGTSHQTLQSIYRSEHSPARTQLFWIKLKNIPLFVSTHLIRHHVGSQPFQLTCRDDREGGNPGLIAKVTDIQDMLAGLVYNNSRPVSDFLPVISAIQDKLEWLKENSDRYTPVNLSILVNAQSLIDMAKLRFCNQASKETRIVFEAIWVKIKETDPALAKFMVPKCIYRGGICGEPKCCGYNRSKDFEIELREYLNDMGGLKKCSSIVFSDILIPNNQ